MMPTDRFERQRGDTGGARKIRERRVDQRERVLEVECIDDQMGLRAEAMQHHAGPRRGPHVSIRDRRVYRAAR